MTRYLLSVSALAIVLLAIGSLAGCGQKGPLFIPGNPSEIQPEPAGQDEEENEEREEEEEEPR